MLRTEVFWRRMSTVAISGTFAKAGSEILQRTEECLRGLHSEP